MNKVAIVGAGAVASAYAHTLLVGDFIDEIVIINLNKKKAEADILDMLHAVPYLPVSPKKIYAGDYADCKNADIVVIAANVPRPDNGKPYNRLESLVDNAVLMKKITENVMSSGFNGIFIVASNPLDIITQVVAEVSGLPKSKVIGTGVLLETARIREIVGAELNINPKNIHGYVLGEHGDTCFTVWSNMTVGSLPLTTWLARKPNAVLADFDAIDNKIRIMGPKIIVPAKGYTSYGIAGALARLTQAIFHDENSILPVSTYLNGEYGHQGIYIGVPAVINSQGIREILEIELTDQEKEKFDYSVSILSEQLAVVKDNI